MADSSSKLPSSRLVYDGAVFRIEFYVAPSRAAPAEAWTDLDAWIQEGRRQNA